MRPEGELTKPLLEGDSVIEEVNEFSVAPSASLISGENSPEFYDKRRDELNRHLSNVVDGDEIAE